MSMLPGWPDCRTRGELSGIPVQADGRHVMEERIDKAQMSTDAYINQESPQQEIDESTRLQVDL